MLDQIKHGTMADWFNRLSPAAYERTGGRSLTEAWQAGDRDAVVAILDDWDAASQTTAERQQGDPEFLAMVEARRAQNATEGADRAAERAEVATRRAANARAKLGA